MCHLQMWVFQLLKQNLCSTNSFSSLLAYWLFSHLDLWLIFVCSPICLYVCPCLWLLIHTRYSVLSWYAYIIGQALSDNINDDHVLMFMWCTSCWFKKRIIQTCCFLLFFRSVRSRRLSVDMSINFGDLCTGCCHHQVRWLRSFLQTDPEENRISKQICCFNM